MELGTRDKVEVEREWRPDKPSEQVAETELTVLSD